MTRTSTPSSVRTAWKWLNGVHTDKWQPMCNYAGAPGFMTRWEAVDDLAQVVWGQTWMDEHERRVQASLDAEDTFTGWDQERARRYAARCHTAWMIDDAILFLRGQS